MNNKNRLFPFEKHIFLGSVFFIFSFFSSLNYFLAAQTYRCDATVAYNCTSAVLTAPTQYYSETQPTWRLVGLWQGTSCGTSQATATTLTVTSSGTYYYRWWDVKTQTWFGNCCSIVVTMDPYSPSDYTASVDKTTAYVGEPVTLTMSRPGTAHGTVTSVIAWGDGMGTYPTPPVVGSWSHTYLTPGNITISNYLTSDHNCTYVYTKAITILPVPALCSTVIPNAAGTFKQDKLTGDIIYSRTDCPVQSLFTCASTPNTLQTKVVASSATTFSDVWPFKLVDVKSASALKTTADVYESGEKGKWRQKGTYVYNTTLITDERNYSAGNYNYQRFNWAAENANSIKWIKTNEVLSYSPHGDGLSERNALDVRNSAKFGYNHSLPILTAQNADYESVLFESFETSYSYNGKIYAEDDLSITSQVIDSYAAHAGSQSLKMSVAGVFVTKPMKLNPSTRKLLVKVWVRLNTHTDFVQSGNFLAVNVRKGAAVVSTNMKVVARTGEWFLCQATIDPGSTEGFVPELKSLYNGFLWIDDLRIQPADAQMNCYVYDKNSLKLLTTFDDQHFGLYYQYNAEGKLVRKMIETRDGIKTLQETQYNTKQTPLTP